MSKSNLTTRRRPRKPASNAKSPKRKLRSVGAGALLIVERDQGRALKLRAQLNMPRETFARLIPMSTRNLANIEAGKPPTPTTLRQINELRRVIDALSEVIQKDAIGPWMGQPNHAFDGLKPIEVIERGEVDRIWQMIFYLKSGIAS